MIDAFAGSGTTAHAVINLNQQDGGNRKFILIEKENYCETITAERVKRVGGNFSFYRLGEQICMADGTLNPAITFDELAAYIWFINTKTPLTEQKNSPLIGVHNDKAYYLLFGEKATLNRKVLRELPPYDGDKIIYGDACWISEVFLRERKIKFKQLPYCISD